MRTRVAAGSRLHFGFLNLSLAHERLYGGLGVAIDDPSVVVEASPAEALECPESARPYARRAVDLLDLPGACVDVEEAIPRHAGLGSGTQTALATYVAIARAHDMTPDPRAAAPALDRGGRSGVGVAAFESGGFVVDAGHPTERFTTDRPPRGEWTVPPVSARHPVPDDWRFVVAVPDVDAGRSGEVEDRSMRAVVEGADPAIADEIAAVVTRQLLPAIAGGDHRVFGRAVAEIGRLNGAWYADAQGGVYRPPAGAIVETLRDCPAVAGVDQSSWGPAVYGVTDVDGASAARAAARDALDEVGVAGEVTVVRGRNDGARIDVAD